MEKSFETCVTEGTLPETVNLQIYKDAKIYERYIANLTIQEHPFAIILGGQMASGKSTLGKELRTDYEEKGGIATIDGDALRDFHPNVKKYNLENDKLMVVYTAKDSARWTERLIEDVSRSKFNMIIETTLRNKEVVTRTVDKLTNAGYDVQAQILVVSFDKSLLGAYSRYETLKAERGAGRFVHDNSLKAAYRGMLETLQALKEQGKCSCIHLHTRKKTLFDGDYRHADILSMVKQERCREYSPAEIRFLHAGWDEVLAKMLTRGADKEEFDEISRRMKERINAMQTEGVAIRNIVEMKRIHQDFKQTINIDSGIRVGIKR